MVLTLRVVCPHVGSPYPRTVEALDLCLQGFCSEKLCVEYVNVAGSDTAYSELVCDLWRQGSGFILCEHDVVPPDGALERFVECPEPLCAHPYAWVTNVGPALGLNKFGADLLAAYPRAADEAASINGGFGPGSWRTFDYWLMRLVLEERYGVVPHLHLPPAEHLNPDKQLAPQFAHLSLAEQLAKVGYRLAEDGLSAEWVGRPRRAVRPV